MASLSKDMSTGREAKNLIVFAIPLFLSYFLQALYGSVDTIIVGQFARLGDVAGVTQGSQVTHILTQGISGLSTGAVVLISRYLGAKRDKDLKETAITLWSLRDPCPIPMGNFSGNSSAADPRGISYAYHQREYENIVAHLSEGAELLLDGRQGRLPLSVILGIYESSARAQVVKL